MTNERLNELYAIYHDGLIDDTLGYWLPNCVDKEDGGFTFAMDREGNVYDTDKGMWQQCRFTWMIAEMYNEVEPRPEWLELAKHGVDFIDKHGFDIDGRMWFHVTKEGEPIRKRRYVFTETFAAIAYAAYSKASGDQAYAKKAQDLFDQIIHYTSTPGALEAKFTDVRKANGIGFPMIMTNVCQQLRKNLGGNQWDAYIDEYITSMRDDYMKHDIKCVMETLSEDNEIMDTFDGRLLNPGHAIEGAWFVMQEARLRGDKEMLQQGLTMLDWMWERGWDKEHGGIIYFRDVYDKPIQEYWHDMKFWWPQNEAIIATLMAYVETGDEKYAKWHQQIHDYGYQNFHDKEHGEWYGYLHRDGRVSTDLKGNLWKAPFHYPRQQLICSQLVDELRKR